MNRTKSLLLFIATLLACYTQAQLTVTAFASRDTICKAESVQLGYTTNVAGTFSCTAATPSCGINGDKIDSLSTEQNVQNGSNVFTWSIYGQFFKCYKSQILYTAQDLLAEFGGAGYFKSIAWKIGQFNSNATMQNYKIRIGCLTPDSTMLGAWKEDLTTVYNAPTYTPIPGWNNHNLSQAYYWDGISNLVIEVTMYTPNTGGNLINFMQYTNRPNSVLYARSNNDIRDSVVALTSSHERPNMRLRMCPADSSLPAIITWHLLDSNGVFSNSTNPSFFPTTTNTYRAKVFYGGDTVFSNPIMVVVKENTPPVIQASEDSIVCADESMDIVLSVGNSYAAYEWTNGDTTAITHITQPGLYNVTVTNAFNCISSAALPFYAIKLSPPVITAVQPNCGIAAEATVSPAFENYVWSNDSIQNPTHIAQTGTYTVTVTTANCIDTASAFVYILDTLPPASFTSYINYDNGFVYLYATPDSGVFYKVYVTSDTTSSSSSSQFYGNATIRLNCSLYQGKFFRLQVYVNGDCSNSTAWFPFPSCTTIGLNDISSEQVITIIPNPAIDYINVNWRGDAKLSDWQIVDAVGKVCIGHISDAANINISALPKGIYILCAKANNTIYRTRFIKQ